MPYFGLFSGIRKYEKERINPIRSISKPFFTYIPFRDTREASKLPSGDAFFGEHGFLSSRFPRFDLDEHQFVPFFRNDIDLAYGATGPILPIPFDDRESPFLQKYHRLVLPPDTERVRETEPPKKWHRVFQICSL